MLSFSFIPFKKQAILTSKARECIYCIFRPRLFSLLATSINDNEPLPKRYVGWDISYACIAPAGQARLLLIPSNLIPSMPGSSYSAPNVQFPPSRSAAQFGSISHLCIIGKIRKLILSMQKLNSKWKFPVIFPDSCISHKM